jgi:phosphoglycolate phosphatase
MARDYDFWLFDLDGDRLGRGFTDQEAAVLWYGQGEARRNLLASHDIAPERFWQVFHEEEQPHERAAATYLYDDAEAFITEQRGPVGLVTHCQTYLTEPILDELGIGDWFDTVVCCDDDIGWKPDPNPVYRAMADMDVGWDGHTGALAGDNPGDIGAARNAGLDGIHVERGSPLEQDRRVGGDHRVTTLRDL